MYEIVFKHQIQTHTEIYTLNIEIYAYVCVRIYTYLFICALLQRYACITPFSFLWTVGMVIC